VAPANYSGALPIPALGVMPGEGGSPAGPYTALLGSQMQMQSLMPPGVMHGQYHHAFGPGNELELAQQQQQMQQQQQQQQQESVSGGGGKKRRSKPLNTRPPYASSPPPTHNHPTISNTHTRGSWAMRLSCVSVAHIIPSEGSGFRSEVWRYQPTDLVTEVAGSLPGLDASSECLQGRLQGRTIVSVGTGF